MPHCEHDELRCFAPQVEADVGQHLEVAHSIANRDHVALPQTNVVGLDIVGNAQLFLQSLWRCPASVVVCRPHPSRR